jgi:hypothetical protein
MPIPIMLNFSGFCVSSTSRFPWICILFLYSWLQNVPSITHCSSVLRIYYSRQWTSFPVSSRKWFSLKTRTTSWLMHSCKWFMHIVWLHLRPVTDEGDFSTITIQAARTLGQLWSCCILV